MQTHKLKEKKWLDKIIIKLLFKSLDIKKDTIDFMQDDLIDSEPEFDIAALEAFEKGKKNW